MSLHHQVGEIQLEQEPHEAAQSTCLQAEFPVSQPPAPGSSEARQMTAGSGRRLYESYGKHRPLGAFLRILLESETWSSTEFYLEWKLKATKSKCLVFQLAPSMPRTGANATGLSESAWPTPMSRDEKGQMFEKGGTTRMDYVPNVLKATWPTPQKQDEKNKYQVKTAYQTIPNKLARGVTTSGCLAQTEKFAVRLGILSAWLMGYPWSYLKNWERKGDKRRKTAKSTEAS